MAEQAQRRRCTCCSGLLAPSDMADGHVCTPCVENKQFDRTHEPATCWRRKVLQGNDPYWGAPVGRSIFESWF